MGPEVVFLDNRDGAPEAGLPHRNCSCSKMHLLPKLQRLKQGMGKINTQPATLLPSDLLLAKPNKKSEVRQSTEVSLQGHTTGQGT